MHYAKDNSKVMSWELYLPPAPPTRSRTTGRFMKGHRPANKGKKWSEYMPKRSQLRCAKGWENVRKYGAHPKLQMQADRKERSLHSILMANTPATIA